MQTLSIAIADPDPELCELLTRYIRPRTNSNGMNLAEFVRENRPTVIIINLAAESSADLPFCFQPDESPPKVFTISRTANGTFSSAASKCGKSPQNESSCRIVDLARCGRNHSDHEPAVDCDQAVELRISSLLRQFGIPAHIKGYQYLRTAIMIVRKNPEIMDAVTKALYPDIAKYYGTTASSVERAMRKAIEVAWDRGNIEYLQHHFQYTIKPLVGRPTNSEFIATVVDILRLQQDQPELMPCV